MIAYDQTQLDKFRLMLLGCTKINPSFHKLPKETKADMLWIFKKVILVINNSWTHRCSYVHNSPTDIIDGYSHTLDCYYLHALPHTPSEYWSEQL